MLDRKKSVLTSPVLFILRFIGQQWGALTVLADNVSAADVHSGCVWEGNDDSADEQHGHDGEGEDPLQSDYNGQELRDTESWQ